METDLHMRYNPDRNRNSRFGDSKLALGSDECSFPAPVIANEILIRQDRFGDSSVGPEECWFGWLQRKPFDVAVAQKLN